MGTKEEEMSGFWICKGNIEFCTDDDCTERVPHKHHFLCTITCGNKCTEMTITEYAVWRLTHNK